MSIVLWQIAAKVIVEARKSGRLLEFGVCTDEVIRSYHAVGVDLQKEVHEGVEKSFSAYPRRWRWLTSHPDTNIDHRRVPNLMIFFSRKGETLPITEQAKDYLPGDLVTWDLGGGVPHIGIVVEETSAERNRHLICAPHRAGPEKGRCLVPMENHRTLPLLRTRLVISSHFRAVSPKAS